MRIDQCLEWLRVRTQEVIYKLLSLIDIYLFILFVHQHMQLKFQIYTNIVNKRGRQCW